MKSILKIFALFTGSLALVLFHAILVDFLPYPLDLLNIIYVGLLSCIFLNTAHTKTLFITVAFLSELYASTPFGVLLVSLVTSLFFTEWMMRTIFTSHSWYMVFLAGVISISLYRLLYIIILAVLSSFLQTGTLPNGSIIVDILQEIVLSSFLLMIFYLLSRPFTKRLNPRYISLS